MSTSIRENIDRLLSTELNRGDFLKVCGVAVLTAVGIGGMLKSLAGNQPTKQKVAQPGAYGGRAFGE